ncbi:pilus assembly protein [Xanthomonas arboricola]|uniref:pilus assembly protein n=1 Tax=Xanthomonas arboricola TaxID=56448 RepID=UPI0009B88FB9|nr:PilC/PilY family type IV pilus protein [Xanthomonas arboricola]CAD7382992.1 pilus assembly protein [Xanthomonas arboricola]CAG2092652.1 pilus assembly protein [Xanthomonas arboricola pv. juglandis]
MPARRFNLNVLALIAAAALCTYGIYAALSAQGQGDLAQAPMNTQSPAQAAFIMAVDDSNSMGFEMLTSIGDLNMRWNSCTRSFFSSAGVFYSGGDNDCAINTGSVIYLFPHADFDKAYGGGAMPPLDQFGFARSPAYNKTYFDPSTAYSPWRKADGTLWDNATPAATRADPRSDRTVPYGVVYDLTSNRSSTSEYFYIPRNTAVPNLAGTGVRYRFNNNWSTAARTFSGTSGRGNNGDNDSSGNAIGNAFYSFDYFPATFYLPAASAAPTGYKIADVNRPLAVNACGPGCNLRRYQIKLENYDNAAAYNAAIQNFANWFQYHRNRTLAMIGSMTQSLANINNMRIGYFTINSRSNDVVMYQMPNERPNLYSAITTLTLNGGTPNRSAVGFLGAQFRRTDAGAPVQLSCQKNAGMLFTDGYTNSNDDSTVDNEDGSLSTPFSDKYAGTIADLASKYYEGSGVPLRTGGTFAAGRVRAPDACATLATTSPDWKRLDCETDLHMNFYGITLGAQGRIYEVNAAATADPYANPPVWDNLPNPSLTDDGTVIDELWHATINSRGEFVNAKTPDEVTAAMRRILSSVASGASPAGSIALTGARIGSGSFTVVPFYEALNSGTDWYGKLTAQRVAASTASGDLAYTDIWEAGALIPQSTSRTIFYGTSTGVAPFNSTNVKLADLCSNVASGMSTCTDAVITTRLKVDATQAVDYLRGNQALETSSTTPLRKRTTRLGDIVNSTPVIESPTDDFGYRSMYDAASNKFDPYNYAAYLKAKAAGGRSMVYVGANDGMLHGFNASNGVEQFAYIPQTALGHMGNLLFPYNAADKNNQYFQHRYYVDGPVAVSDVASAVDSWSTVLVGTAGAGGKSVFALNVTSPSSFSANSRLWELSDSNSNAAISRNIGNVLGKPVIVPVRSPSGVVRWKAIFGNGYGSANGRAVLFVVDILSGRVNLIPAIEAGINNANGLGNIVVLDRFSGSTGTESGRDGSADTVYAADQLGAIWKFDLRSLASNPATPETAATLALPLFVAKDAQGARQPVLGGLRATAGPGGGVMLFFGTGGFSFRSDASDTSQQTLYGVLDRGSATTIQRADLLQQRTVSSSVDSRETTTLAMPAGGLGWYLDLPGQGERFVGNPAIQNGIVFFPTFQPGSTDGCLPGGTNWLYGLSALSGAAQLSGVRVGAPTGPAYSSGTGAVALKTEGSSPVKDVAVMTMPRQGPLTSDASSSDLDNALSRQCQMMINLPGSKTLFMARACGRQSWRQIK